MGPVDRGQIDELRQQAALLPYSPAKVGLLEEAIRFADLLGDVGLGYDARTELINAAVFSGSPEKAMVAFSWNLAQFDRKAVERADKNILWDYKYIINNIVGFPQIDRNQILGALADFERRLERSGLGMRSLHKLHYSVAWNMGSLDEARDAYERWQRTPRGELSDCAACDLNTEVEYLVRTHRDEDALLKAKPILAGSLKCTVVPQNTLAGLLLPLVRLDRVAEAVPYHRRGYRMIARNPYFPEHVARHIEFLTLTRNLPRAVKLFETHCPHAIETFDLSDRFRFALGADLLFDRLKTSGTTSLRLRLPASFPVVEPSGSYQVSTLASWISSDTVELAQRFDARNGNDAYTHWIKTNRELSAFDRPFPLKPPGNGITDKIS